MRYCTLCLSFLLAALVVLVSPTLNTANASVSGQEFQKWLDGAFKEAEQKKRFSAAVVRVGNADETILDRTYGTAFLNRVGRSHHDAAQYRIGSITKVFVGVAIAQLIERGDIESINDPVNTYLKRLQLPANRSAPVTIRQLLTHSAGVEERSSYFMDYNYWPEMPGDSFLSAWPSYFRPSGEGVTYCNICVSALALLIEDVSSQRLDVYLRENVFNPLGMESTYLDYGGAPSYNLAEPQQWTAAGTREPIGTRAVTPLFAASGGVVSTSDDMSLFARAMLGALRGEESILSRKSAENMLSPVVRNSYSHPAIGYLWWIDDRHARGRWIEHSGSWIGFTSIFVLLPDEDAFIFVSVAGARAQKGFPDAGIGPYLNAAIVSQAIKRQVFGDFANVLAYDQSAADRYAGRYLDDRRSHATLEKATLIVAGAAAQLTIKVEPDGLYLNESGPFLPVGEDRFVNTSFLAAQGFPDQPQYEALAFKQNANGAIIGGAHSAISTFSREGWLMNATRISGLLPFAASGAVLCFLTGLWKKRTRITAFAKAASYSYGVSFLALLTFSMIGVASNTVLAALSNVAAIGAVGLIGVSCYAWTARRRTNALSLFARLYLTVLATLGLITLLILAYGNLIGFRLP